jgi:HIRAN domain
LSSSSWSTSWPGREAAARVGSPSYTGTSPYADFDEEIAKWVRTNPDIDKWFWGKVAGVTHDNPNGTSRQTILKRCQARELLRLVPEPGNPVDAHAIAVLRQNGEQLGYLDRRLAGETWERMQKGEHWQAMLMAVTGTTHPHAWLGANIVMFRTKLRQDVSAQ